MTLIELGSEHPLNPKSNKTRIIALVVATLVCASWLVGGLCCLTSRKRDSCSPSTGTGSEEVVSEVKNVLPWDVMVDDGEVKSFCVQEIISFDEVEDLSVRNEPSFTIKESQEPVIISDTPTPLNSAKENEIVAAIETSSSSTNSSTKELAGVNPQIEYNDFEFIGREAAAPFAVQAFRIVYRAHLLTFFHKLPKKKYFGKEAADFFAPGRCIQVDLAELKNMARPLFNSFETPTLTTTISNALSNSGIKSKLLEIQKLKNTQKADKRLKKLPFLEISYLSKLPLRQVEQLFEKFGRLYGSFRPVAVAVGGDAEQQTYLRKDRTSWFLCDSRNKMPELIVISEKELEMLVPEYILYENMQLL
jgi:hypothetical protein